MKNKLSLLVFLLLLPLLSISQENDSFPSGEPHFTAFWNYHYDFTENTTQESAFEIARVYLGYKYTFNDAFSAKITYDIGKNSSGSSHTAFLKIAQLDWKVNSKFKLSMGMIGGKMFKDQEKIWGYRYLYKTLQDEYKFGSSADLGVNAEIKISDKLTSNVFIVNGEGYKNVQDEDGNQRFGTNLIYKLNKNITTKFYYDTHEVVDSKAINNIGFFVGYKSDKFRFGAEYNEMQNGETYKTASENHNLTGLSFYGSYLLNEKFEVFVRYDKLTSNQVDGSDTNWNYENDGNLSMVGIEYKAVKGVKFSLNSRTFNYKDSNIRDSSLVYLNAEFKL
ncbi:porin [Flavobacteriaceae bacterium]|nr:porin [Flavobacteriaceae bacterium]MDC1492562.1 porin [Flavobacteriaceae bacterium]